MGLMWFLIYSMVISLMLCAYLLAGSRKGQKLNWYFGLMCLLNACMSVGDMSNWLCEGLWNPWNPLLLRVGSLPCIIFVPVPCFTSLISM